MKHEQCYICNHTKCVSVRTPEGKPICNYCVFKIKNKKCHRCEEKSKRYDDDKNPICLNCFIKLCRCQVCGEQITGWRGRRTCKTCSPKTRTKIKCNFCGNIKFMEDSKKNLCGKCLKIIAQDKCHSCGTLALIVKINGSNMCRDCFNEKKDECCFCNKVDIISKSLNEKPICNSCYRKRGGKSQQCSVCKETNRIEDWQDNKPICKRCYKSPPQKCSMCGENKVIKKNTKEGPLCDNCYMKHKCKNNEAFRISQLLRRRLNSVLRSRSKNGKTQTSDEYGINYAKIIEHLGPCPGKREDYHIDHIFPLIAFDWDNLMHIAIAFSPENHQWLPKKENLQKGDYYNEQEFKEFLNDQVRKL